MIISQSQYFLLFVSSYALVGFLTPLMRKLAISKEILDRPNSAHKSHIEPIPYLGGVAIILGVILVTYISLLFSRSPLSNFWLVTSLIAPALAMGMIGLWDDIKTLPPFPRFIGQTITGIIVSVILIFSNSFANPTGATFLDVIVTIFWVVGICNSINFFDNLDGGAAGSVAVSTITLTYLSLSNGQSSIAAMSLVVAGATLGFLIWNRSPARIYMGDAGALFLGVLLATLTIRLEPETNSLISSFATILLLLAVPILDTSVAVFSRLRRRISPFQGGKDHLSHRLIRAGLSRKISAAILWLLSAFFCLIAIMLSHLNPILEVRIVVISALIWLLLFVGFMKRPDF
jgi:UDP-GlcNAc:undecaprenyl-phosphate GlcNAc-1-phosphate transferase